MHKMNEGGLQRANSVLQEEETGPGEIDQHAGNSHHLLT
jgi:hypothetical protein